MADDAAQSKKNQPTVRYVGTYPEHQHRNAKCRKPSHPMDQIRPYPSSSRRPKSSSRMYVCAVCYPSNWFGIYSSILDHARHPSVSNSDCFSTPICSFNHPTNTLSPSIDRKINQSSRLIKSASAHYYSQGTPESLQNSESCSNFPLKKQQHKLASLLSHFRLLTFFPHTTHTPTTKSPKIKVTNPIKKE